MEKEENQNQEDTTAEASNENNENDKQLGNKQSLQRTIKKRQKLEI